MTDEEDDEMFSADCAALAGAGCEDAGCADCSGDGSGDGDGDGLGHHGSQCHGLGNGSGSGTGGGSSTGHGDGSGWGTGFGGHRGDGYGGGVCEKTKEFRCTIVLHKREATQKTVTQITGM
jgi:hypothetical protein